MKIFISIASYQDPLLLETLCSAYTNARYKNSLVFGVCEQADDGIDVSSLTFKNQLKYELLDPVMAKGPCWARGRIQNFYSNEDFFLQIDSHTIFTPDWDHILLENHAWLEKTQKDNFVITGYPRKFEPNDDLSSFELDTASKITWGITFQKEKLFEDGHYSGQHGFPSNSCNPLRGLLIAAGFIFAKGRFVKEIPYDPKFYFHGEELSLAIRIYTNNWNAIYIPETPLFHFYTDVNNLPRKLHWDEEDEKNRIEKWTELDRKSKSRLSDLILNRLEGSFGLGKHRTINEFEKKIGIDLNAKKIKNLDLATSSLSFEEIESNGKPYNKLLI
tara:strand:+ start:1531 stop:2523 length:993 start_codon:yes stop_codon:yes gene_type:complete